MCVGSFIFEIPNEHGSRSSPINNSTTIHVMYISNECTIIGMTAISNKFKPMHPAESQTSTVEII
jgi:hypothetical protein